MIASVDGCVETAALMREARFVCFDVVVNTGDGRPGLNRLGCNIHVTACCIGVGGRLVAYG